MRRLRAVDAACACLVLGLIGRCCGQPLGAILLDGLSIESGLVTTSREFYAGDILLELPASLVMTKDSAQDTELLRFLDPPDGRSPPGVPHWSALPEDFVMALQLALVCAEAQAGERTEAVQAQAPSTLGTWSTWLGTATAQLHGTRHWRAEEHDWLDGSRVLQIERELSARIASQLTVRYAPRTPPHRLASHPSQPDHVAPYWIAHAEHGGCVTRRHFWALFSQQNQTSSPATRSAACMRASMPPRELVLEQTCLRRAQCDYSWTSWRRTRS
jgi:hypothetical protein